MITTQTSKENIFSRINKKGGHLHRDKTKRGEGEGQRIKQYQIIRKKKEGRGGFTWLFCSLNVLLCTSPDEDFFFSLHIRFFVSFYVSINVKHTKGVERLLFRLFFFLDWVNLCICLVSLSHWFLVFFFFFNVTLD